MQPHPASTYDKYAKRDKICTVLKINNTMKEIQLLYLSMKHTTEYLATVEF